MDKSYRIHTNVINDTILNVNMEQDFDMLEVLSLKLRQQDAYRLHSSNYGVIIGRVLANDAFGIPNAKVSLFIERDANDSSDIEALYPYTEITSKDKDGRRYNILPDYSDDSCYRVVGTFPNKRLMLDNDVVLEVYDKYWKYTTVTNQAGDYMLFGVPSGSQQIHVDIDLSDIGALSQKPRDFEYKGYNIKMFDNPNQFKESTNLESLAQLFSQNKSVFVYPFWGDSDNGIAAITRSDIQIQYKFEPTCVFMGSIVSDNEGHAIGHKCAPDIDNGMNDQLVAGQGTIEMIRKTTDGFVEEFQIQGNQLIDEDGVWCYQIPMNLDFVGTDEYGNIVPTDNPTKGIPTRTQVRFRFSKTETLDEGVSHHTAKYLVPMNPIFSEGANDVIPRSLENGAEVEKMYNFGSDTPQSCFRDLYWNNVYSVKNYIPKVQVAHRPYSANYSALKGSNLATDQNPIPFNKLRIDIPFLYMLVCILFEIITTIVYFINALVICTIDNIFSIFNGIRNLCISILWARICPFKLIIPKIPYIGCLSLGGGFSEDNTAFYPGCYCSEGRNASDCPEDMENNCKKSWNPAELVDRIQRNLALEFKIVKLDFYQDWINGCLYMPLWYWRKRKKKTFLFGIFSRSAQNDYCSSNKIYSRLKTYLTCNFKYNDNDMTLNSYNEREGRWHRNGAKQQVRYKRGLIKEFTNKDNLKVYYYSAIQPTTRNANDSGELNTFGEGFYGVRLYATDIILLGNLDENNLYGIPQFFKSLPSTTANVPAIATIAEGDNDKESDNAMSVSEDSGITITTGMDWGRNGDEETPKYSSGLFMDLACTYATTKAKSCLNVERMSELGVNLDMTHTTTFSNGNGILKGTIEADGFINKLELDDNDNRAMFATMNHMGFIPQDYQDKKGMYQTQVYDKNTNYLIPKFKYIYPTDFDGRMAAPMNRYKGNFKQNMSDIRDQEYLTFRLGAETENSAKNNSEGRIRHFYYTYEMPLYNNSFYFYFGINKGSTAIDKFNNMFYSECFKNKKIPFTIDYTTTGQSYCSDAYTDTDKAESYGTIVINLDDIQLPYSYELYNSFGDIVSFGEKRYEGKNVKDRTIRFGGESDENLNNETYKIVITDGNGKTLTKRINLNIEQIEAEYEATNLGNKFYNDTETPRSFICSETNQFYGKIEVDKIIIDGHYCNITNVFNISGDVVESGNVVDNITFSCDSDDKKIKGAEGTMKLSLVASEDASGITDCMCNSDSGGTGTVPSWSAVVISSYTDDTSENIINYKKIVFYVYRPGTYNLTVTQLCNDSATNNISSEFIKIANGANFNTYLNGMPLRFMIGNIKSLPSKNNNFYKLSGSAETATTSPYLKGWYGVHQEDAYLFEDVNMNTQKLWSDFINIDGDITTLESKRKILEFKFKTMFSLSNGVYVTDDVDHTLRYSHTGGNGLILERCLIPNYADEKKLKSGIYIYDDYNASTAPTTYPNLVGGNYDKGFNGVYANSGVTFNKRIGSGSTREEAVKLQGSYFAAFTNNGGYVSEKKIPSGVSVMSLPYKSAVNAYKGSKVKALGFRDENANLTNMTKAWTAANDGSYMPYLRGMFVDRRFDYDFVILGPCVEEDLNSKIMEDHYFKFKGDWKCMNIIGTTYGGIEMSYDDDYNIISATSASTATTEDGIDVVVAARENNSLEYSYCFSGGNSGEVKTYYNSRPDTVKRFYESTVNDIDIRNGAESDEGEFPIVKSWRWTNDFNMNSITTSGNTNYPTIHKFYVKYISGETYLSYNNICCSYDMTPNINEDGTISCNVARGERTYFDITFYNPIDIIPIDGSHIIYGFTESGTTLSNRTSRNINFNFKYNDKVSSSFDSYVQAPRIIDAKYITMLKSKIDDNEIQSILNNKNGSHCTIKDYKNTSSTKFPSGVGYDGSIGFYVLDKQPLTSLDTDFLNILFWTSNMSFNGDYFAILTTRYHHDDDGSLLLKRIKTYELSKIYSMTNITVSIIDAYVDKIIIHNEETGSERTTYLQHIIFSITSDLIPDGPDEADIEYEFDFYRMYSYMIGPFVNSNVMTTLKITNVTDLKNKDEELSIRIEYMTKHKARFDVTLGYGDCLGRLYEIDPADYTNWSRETSITMSIILKPNDGLSYKIQRDREKAKLLTGIVNNKSDETKWHTTVLFGN